jgi:hypothetical protein
MNELGVQTGLWKWFTAFPSEHRSLSSIENRCRNLWIQYAGNEENATLAKYYYFYPLLRTGVIEFYGENKFGLSPSTLLYTNTKSLFINPNIILMHQLELKTESPGCFMKDFSHEDISLCERLNIPVRNFILRNLLNRITHFEKIIKSWPIAKITDTQGLAYFSNEWNPTIFDSKIGIYQRSGIVYSRRYFYSDSNQWVAIPDRAQNVDAWNIAVMAGKILNETRLKITYLRGPSILKINEPYFPILLERMLYLNTILNFTAGLNISKREYFINGTDFDMLNRLTNNLITVL